MQRLLLLTSRPIFFGATAGGVATALSLQTPATADAAQPVPRPPPALTFSESVARGAAATARVCRDGVCAAKMAWVYSTRVDADGSFSTAHEEGAELLLQLCRPDAYIERLKSLYDTAPQSSFDDVYRVLEEDLGGAAAVKAAFANISEEPIASASLAQVHVAYLHDGTKVAVKVQHRGLREACNVDMAVVEALVHAVKWWKEEVDYRWIADEMRRNLPLELDFKHEAQNAARCARHFAHRDDIVVPFIVSELTTHRVLVMSFEDGVSVADSAGLAARRLDKAEVAEPVTIANARQRNHLNVLTTRALIGAVFSFEKKRPIQCKCPLSLPTTQQPRLYADLRSADDVMPIAPRLVGETFNEQIFQHGFVHCDPHPGNVLVRQLRPTERVDGGGSIGMHGWTVASTVFRTVEWVATGLWNAGSSSSSSSSSTDTDPSSPPSSVAAATAGHTTPQLVLLDHGLYRELPDELRLSYARFWMSIILQDQEGMKAQAEVLGAGDLYPLLACMLTRKSWDKIMPNATADDPHVAGAGANDHAATAGVDPQPQQPHGNRPPARAAADAVVLLNPDTSSEAKAELQGNVSEYAKEIVAVLSTVNRDLLLLFKTNDCLMHLAHELGAPLSIFSAMTRHVALALKDDDSKQGEQTRGFRWWVVKTVLAYWK